MPGRWIEAGRAPAFSAKAGQKAMPVNSTDDNPEKARRFRDAALPHLDDVYTLARYLLRDAADAEDAVQECYLRALRHFDSYRGPAMKPWLFAILPTGLAWTLNLIAAYEVAVVGMYLFLRRQPMSTTAATFGAAAFSFGGFLSAQIVHIDLISGAAWLPWMLVAVQGLTESAEARSPTDPPTRSAPPRWWWALLLAAATALTILAGARGGRRASA